MLPFLYKIIHPYTYCQIRRSQSTSFTMQRSVGSVESMHVFIQAVLLMSVLEQRLSFEMLCVQYYSFVV